MLFFLFMNVSAFTLYLANISDKDTRGARKHGVFVNVRDIRFTELGGIIFLPILYLNFNKPEA